MTEQRYQNEVITETLQFDKLLTGTSVGTFYGEYMLCEAEFIHIKNEAVTLLRAFANSISLLIVGFIFNMISKWYSQTDSNISQITKGEWIIIITGVIILAILHGIAFRLPNERKKVMNDIENHFKSAPKWQGTVKGLK